MKQSVARATAAGAGYDSQTERKGQVFSTEVEETEGDKGEAEKSPQSEQSVKTDITRWETQHTGGTKKTSKLVKTK